MYEETYGLREKPFSLVPDPEFLFLSRLHRGALNILEYGLQEQASFALISGEVGTGKTILVRRFLRTIGDRVTVGVITSTPRNKKSVLDRILLAFGLDYRGKGLTELHETFMGFLEAQEARKRRTVLIIDEAQNLDPEALEELRMLANVNVDKNIVLQVVLVGQPEILEILNRRELRQLAQRITINFKLLPLSFPETRKYIRHRLRVAGGNPETFSTEACAVIHLLSGGLPRLVNSLCDAALVYGYGEGRAILDSEIVIEIVIDDARGGLAKFPEVDANFNIDEVLRIARELSEGIGPDDDQELTDETEIHWDRHLPSPEAESGIKPELATESEPDGRLKDEYRYRKRKQIVVAAFALSALMTAGLIWKFNLGSLGPVEVDRSQSVNMDVKKAPPSLSPGPATDRAAGVAANQPKTAEPAATDIAASGLSADAASEETTQPIIQQPAMPAPATAQREPPSEAASAAAPQPVGPAGAAPKLDQSADASEAEQPEQQIAAAGTSSRPAPVEPEVNAADSISGMTPEGQSAKNPETDRANGKIATATTPAPSAVNDAPTGGAALAIPEARIALIAPPTPKVEVPPKNLPEILAHNDFGQYIDAFEELFGIWNLDYSSLGGVAPCHKAFAAGLSCYQHGGTLAKLRRLNLPAIIGLKRPTGELAYAVLTGISGSHVKLRFGDNAVTAPINEVSSRLSGSFILLWKSPIQFKGAIWEGSHGETVTWLRDSLDEIMPEGFRPGRGTFYNSAVNRAVKEFQKDHGLHADGVVDLETLIAISMVLYKNRIPSLTKL